MPTSYTSLLGLALPVTGELSGTWGDTVNQYITQYVDAAVAGAQTISGSQTAVTLSVTNGSSLTQAGAGATGSAQYQIINCTGNPASALTVTVPSSSRTYLVLNNTSTNQTVTVKGAATTGVTVAAARSALIAWNGTDFELVATDDASKISGILAVANGGTGLSSGTSGGVPYFSGSTTMASSAALAANALVVGGGAGAAPATVTTGTGVVTALGVNTGTAGSFVVNGGALGTPSSGTVTNLTGTASININGTVGGTTPAAGSFTTLAASSTVSGTGFSNYLASPPAIGGTAANTGAFTTLTATSASVTGASGVLTRAAATQDGIEMIGRAGGTLSYKVSMTPTTLTASRTVTMPDANIDFTTGLAVANGGTGSTTASGARTNLGATTVGGNFFTLANPSAITFIRVNADNTVSTLDAATFRTAIGAGTGGGSVTSVSGTGTVNGISLSGTVTSSGSLTLSGAISGVPNSATTATNLNTASAIVARDASGNFSAGTITATLSGTATQVSNNLTLATSGTGLSGSATFNGSSAQTFTVTSNATSANTASTIVARDASGNFSAGTITATLSGNATNVSGTVAVANGGTGATTLTGVLKGNGTSAFTAATAGTDFVAPGTATTFTATQTFSGSSSAIAMVLNDAAEVTTVSATAATGTINYDVTTQSVLFYTTNASGNFVVNLRASSGTSLNTALATGQSITVVFLVTNGGTAYYNTSVQVDGTTTGVTTRWQGGTAPTAGNASSVDAYTYTVIKTGSATFSVFAAQTRFA